ncbi:hypothetical protein VPH35_022335 [Triticum aestivum]
MAGFSHVDPARRPRESHKMVVAMPALEHAEYILRQHAVTVTAADRAHATSPMAVGKAIEEQLRTSAHQLRVTAHHPEAFLVHFDLPAHRDNAVRRGIIKVDGCKFFIRAWSPDDHAAILKLSLHVRIVVENLPMQFWSLEGADDAFGDFGRIDRLDSRTYERGHTKTFRALWVLKRGAGRVDEIIGFSPPDRNVPPPPGVHRYDLPIHVDRVEDWNPLSPRSSHSGQSRLPSSEDEDTRPLPRSEPGSWAAGVEDGQSRTRRSVPRVSSSGCSSFPSLGERCDHDGDDQGNRGRSWKDAFLGRGRQPSAMAPAAEEPRRRSRTPASHRHQGCRGRSVEHAALSPSSKTVLRATPPCRCSHAPPPPPPPPETGPITTFFSFSDSGRAISPPPRSDCMQLEFENAMLEALASPLSFSDNEGPIEQKLKEDHLPLALLPDVLPCINQPTPAAVQFQVEAVTQKVNHLQLQTSPDADSAQPQPATLDDVQQLFKMAKAPVLPTPKPARSSAPPKSRASSAPSRRSARQALAASSVPVSQRAAMRLVKEVGKMGPKDKMTPDAAAALIKKFNEPLTEEDIATIARLTSLNVEALKIAAGMLGPNGAANAAQ